MRLAIRKSNKKFFSSEKWTWEILKNCGTIVLLESAAVKISAKYLNKNFML